MKKSVSELRQDVVSGDWVVVATARARRPHDFLAEKRVAFAQPQRTCPFENISSAWVKAIPNKYPAFGKGVCALFHRVGPYQWTEGVGFHEVIITRDHERSFAQMSPEEAVLVVGVYQERLRALSKKECSAYVAVFHNHGRLSGASISHPHSQIVAIPVVPPDVARSLKGSLAYFKKHRACVHCAVVKYESAVGARIIYENDSCAIVAPYASKTAFEMRIFPKRHSAYFADMADRERAGAADALRTALAKLHKGLQNPDYNFFLHTAPVGEGKEFSHYHWHIEILPKTSIWAGFEIGTGIDISTIAPESAAAFLRKIKI